MTAAPPLTHPSELGYVPEALRLAFPAAVPFGDRFVVIITGYFDASGKHKGSRALAVGGFLARSDEWGAFAFEWEEALKEWGLEAFHMAPFAHSLGPFKDWAESVRRERLGRLLAIINRHVIGSAGVVIPLELYAKYFAGRAVRQSGGPYAIAGVTLFREVADLVIPVVPDAEIAYVYEIGDEGHGQFLKVFADNQQDPAQRAKYRLLSLRFEDKRQFVALQAADILAYEMYRDFERYSGLEKRDRRYPLQILWAKPNNWSVLGEESMALFAEAVTLGLEHSTGTWHVDPTAIQRERQSLGRSRRGR